MARRAIYTTATSLRRCSSRLKPERLGGVGVGAAVGNVRNDRPDLITEELTNPALF